MSVLKRCPFCGGEAAHGSVKYHPNTVRVQEWDQAEWHFVNCIHCGASNRGLVGHQSPTAAVEHWNKRDEGDRAERLAMLVLQAELYADDADVRDAVDAIVTPIIAVTPRLATVNTPPLASDNPKAPTSSTQTAAQTGQEDRQKKKR